METLATNRTLDRRGKIISTFVVYDAAAELDAMSNGEVLEIVTDDYEPLKADIAAWCQATGQRLIESESTSEGLRLRIEKRPTIVKDTKLAMILSVAGLEELLSPLGFALAAALEGIEVNLYVQGPAVRILKRGFHPKLPGWGRPFSRFAAAGMSKMGHIPAQDKMVQLQELGAHIYMCGPSMQHFKVAEGDLILDDLSQVEYLTFMAVMEQADIQIFV